MFKGENSKGSLTSVNSTATFSPCCSHGAVKLPPIKEPPATLLTGSTKKDRDLRERIFKHIIQA